MGTLFSSLSIGRAGLMVSQTQLDIAGHNISNVNREGFTRQRVELSTYLPNIREYGALGRGPNVKSISRLRDAYLDVVYRNQVPQLGQAELSAQYFGRIEDIFLEPSDQGFSTRLNGFIDSLNDFADNVEEIPVRESMLSEANAMAGSLRDVARRLNSLRTNANEEVRNLVPEINSLGSRIADSNEAIFRAELSGRKANDLRDERDNLMDQLSRLVNISYRERDSGYVDVMIGGEEFVSTSKVFDLTAAVDSSLDPNRPDLLSVRFAGTGLPVTVKNGELYGALLIRDTEIKSLSNRVDELARGLIYEMNRIQTQGNGIANFTTALTATQAVTDPAAALNSAGLSFAVKDGSFDIRVYNNANTLLETITVPVNATGGTPTTLNDIIAAINASPNVTASENNGQLVITPAAGRSFVFANDSSEALNALGMNTFFTGDSASSIMLNTLLTDDPRLVSSAYSSDVLETGDNTAALDMAGLRSKKILDNTSQSGGEFYESTIVGVGVNARANQQMLEIDQQFVNDFNVRRQEVSGVNLDEEVSTLIQFQRAFEASARLITTTDNMLQTLIGMAT